MAKHRKSTATPILAALAVVCLLVGAYVGAYCCLLAEDGAVQWDLTRFDPPVLAPNYRYGGDVAAMFFAPIHQIDKRLRPDRWNAFRYISP